MAKTDHEAVKRKIENEPESKIGAWQTVKTEKYYTAFLNFNTKRENILPKHKFLSNIDLL